MNLSALRTRLEAKHSASPQNARRVQLAIAELESGLTALASLGHPMHLVEGSGEAPELGWPRLLFHIDAAPNGRLVFGEAEARELGPEWHTTLERAQHADGVKTQFAGRGGIGTRNVPTISNTAPTVHQVLSPSERIAAWKLQQALLNSRH